MKLRYLKRDQIYNENAKFELPEKDIFLWFMFWRCLDRSRYKVHSCGWYALTSLTINRNLRLNLNISGAKFKKIKQGKFTKRSNRFELLENADIMRARALFVAIDNAVDYSWCILIKIFNNIKFTTKFNYLRSQILLVNLYLELNLKSKNRVDCEFVLLKIVAFCWLQCFKN